MVTVYTHTHTHTHTAVIVYMAWFVDFFFYPWTHTHTHRGVFMNELLHPFRFASERRVVPWGVNSLRD